MRKIAASMFMIGILLAAGIAGAATVDISWTNPTTYNDGSPIATVDQANIVTSVYVGGTISGPWTLVGTSVAGGTSLTGASVTMTRGTTYYFTAKSTLNSMTSAYGTPTSYLYPNLAPAAPGSP
ncbi:MAG: hypothetical protein HZA60_04785, partial [Deltaproteobacteria bacterium]|nr:hypothetical protein [Deltaproteobacteria bacterium]